jgi:hypothetical protein
VSALPKTVSPVEESKPEEKSDAAGAIAGELKSAASKATGRMDGFCIGRFFIVSVILGSSLAHRTPVDAVVRAVKI